MTCAYVNFMDYDGVKRLRVMASKEGLNIDNWSDDDIKATTDLFAQFFDEYMPRYSLQRWLASTTQV